MKIGIHTKELENARPDGTRIYLSQVLNHLSQHDTGDKIVLYHAKDFDAQYGVKMEQFTNRQIADGRMWTNRILPQAVTEDDLDVLWIPLHNVPTGIPEKTKVVITVHDLAFLKFPKTYPLKDRLLLTHQTKKAVSRADHIIAVSQSTKDDLLKHYKDLDESKISVVHHGIDTLPWDRYAKAHNRLDKCYIQKPYVLYHGALQPRKGIATLIQAFESFKTSHPEAQLIIAGAEAWKSDQIKVAAMRSPHYDDIIMTGKVNFAALQALVSHATIAVQPSLYEGFGLTVLECLAARTPLIVADNSSLSEVAGDAALKYHTGNAGELAQQMKTLWRNVDLQDTLTNKGYARAKEFTWKQTAQKTLAIIQNLQ